MPQMGWLAKLSDSRLHNQLLHGAMQRSRAPQVKVLATGFSGFVSVSPPSYLLIYAPQLANWHATLHTCAARMLCL